MAGYYGGAEDYLLHTSGGGVDMHNDTADDLLIPSNSGEPACPTARARQAEFYKASMLVWG